MVRFAALASVTMALASANASAQIVYVQSAPAVYAPPVTVYSSPVVSYPAPTVSYYAPATSYYAAPVVSYYAPPVYTPAVSYSYYPVYSAPAVVPGAVTTRSYYGLGIFRPRGLYTESYWSPWR